MKKILRIVNSRFFLGAVAIVLQFLELLLLLGFLRELLVPLSALSWVLYFALLLHLINRDELPEFKLLWLIMLRLAPVVGVLMLLLFSSNRTGRRAHRRYTRAQAEVAAFLPESCPVPPTDGALQARYLRDLGGMPCCQGTDARYFPLGEDFWKSLLADLERAEKFIFMEYFILQQGKMWDAIVDILRRKAAAGVEVCVMYDDLGCIATLPSRYYRQLNRDGIRCIRSCRFTPVLSHVHNNRDHRKITVIDGRVGYTGGINLADEYINHTHPYGHWKDTAVRLEGSGVWNLTALFVTHWNAQGESRLEPRQYLQAPPPVTGRGYLLPFGTGPRPIYREELGKNVYLNLIGAAREYLYICTPYLICDREMFNALGRAAQMGVDVRLITPAVGDAAYVHLMTRSNYQLLVDSGVQVFEYTPGFIHAKSFVCDDRYAVCGTLNLDYRSLVHHFECGVWMWDTPCIGDMKADFLATQAVSTPITPEKARLRGFSRLAAEAMKLFTPLM